MIDVPSSHWDVDEYYNPDPTVPDKTHCNRGGFLPDIDFDPLEFGLPPNILEVTDVSQLLALIVARDALEDAGYAADSSYNHERTGVILGVVGGRQLITPLTTRLQYPVWRKVLKSSGVSDEDSEQIIEKMKLAYVRWEESAFPGLLGNVVAGRITNRLNLGGTNCVVDAACASSLSAIKMSLSELAEGRCDMMISGGVDTDNSIFMYMCFSKTPAISSQMMARPFDKDADGMMLGEGLGMVVLKRLEDAERDGDRIYAVIKGIGTSSDGKHKSIYAPHPVGQARALQAAYDHAGFAPHTVGLVEAHGTGTVAGDLTEFTSLRNVFSQNNPRKQHIALGSVKSQIGHTKATAGAASLIKAALALHHKILPPTLNVDEPNPKFAVDDSPFYLNTETRPWLHTEGQPPRRAGVSSFGFGGTNFHIVLEEHTSEHQGSYRLHDTARPVLLHADTPAALAEQCETLAGQLQSAEAAQHYAALLAAQPPASIPQQSARVGFVVESLAEAQELLQICSNSLRKQPQSEAWQHPRGIHYRSSGLDLRGKVAALFSGQGSQYINMGRELALHFPEVRHTCSTMDSLFQREDAQPLSEVLFPRPVFSEAQQKAQAQALQRTEYAQPALGVLSASLYKILQQAGFRPDFVAGHSFGELSALWAAGVLNDADYFALVRARGKAMAPLPNQDFDAGTMLAVTGDISRVEQEIQGIEGVTVANLNSPRQVVLAGATAAVGQAQQHLQSKGYSVVALPVSAAFHTPLVQHAQQPFAQAIRAASFNRPSVPVYSNTTGQPYPTDPAAIQETLAQHILKPVLFQREIEALYANGAHLFIEFGPRNVLTNLVKETLGDRPHIAIALNGSRQKGSARQLQEAIVQLCVTGLPLQPTDSYQVPLAPPPVRKRKGFNFRLNGNNYVSDKTRQAFEHALQDDHQVPVHTLQPSQPAPTPEPVPVPEPVISEAPAPHPEPAAPVAPVASSAAPLHREERAMPESEMPDTPAPAPVAAPVPDPEPVATEAPTPAPDPMPAPQPEPVRAPAGDYQQLLESLEQGVAQLHEHQGNTLRVHEQYLQHQSEFSHTFFTFIQQQQSLLQQQRALPPGVLEGLGRSASLLHEHQAETLRIHEQYMESHSEHARMLFEVIRQRHALFKEQAKEQDITSRVAAPAPGGEIPTPPPAATPEPVAASATPAAGAPPAPAPQPEPAPAAKPTGQGNGSHAAAVASVDDGQIGAALLDIVSEKTGYPVEMLEPDMDLEADLGIDSIKRVEILGAMQEAFPQLPRLTPEELAELHTLGEIRDHLRAAAGAPPAATPEPAPQPVNIPDVPRGAARLRPLPEPDFMDTALPKGYSCLLTDDGTPLTAHLAHLLSERGWPVVVLSFPETLVPGREQLPAGVQRVALPDMQEASLMQALQSLTTSTGPVGAFIHLQPASRAGSGGMTFSEREKVVVQHVFLLAKHLKPALNEAAQRAYGYFVTVARLDGEFGLGNEPDFGAIGGGLFGLTKTLNLEWEPVFCRAIDLAAGVTPDQAARHIIAELHDPNRFITEVGYGLQGRATLVGV